MTSPTADIFPPSSFEVVISQIASLTDDAFKSLKAEIETEAAFDVDKERCERLSPALNISPQATAVLLSAISILFDRVAVLPSDASLHEVLTRFVDGFDEGGLDVNSKKLLATRLFELAAPNPTIESWAKIRRLRIGFLDKATEFATFVDLRPDFAPGYESIRGFVPIIQFRVRTDSDDPSKAAFVWQLDEQGLANLKKAADAAQLKLDTLRKSNVLAVPLLFKKRA